MSFTSISLINYYLTNNRAPCQRHSILNSNARTTTGESSPHLVITYSPPGSIQTLQYPLPKLQELNESILQWVDTFREISSMCGWTESVGLAFIKAALNPTIWAIIKNRTTQDTDALCSAAFPSASSYMYLKEMSQIQQNEFWLIKEYHSAIELAVSKWALSTKTPRKESERRIEEIFFNGLAGSTAIELQRQGIVTLDQALEYLQRVENTIMQFPSTPAP